MRRILYQNACVDLQCWKIRRTAVVFLRLNSCSFLGDKSRWRIPLIQDFEEPGPGKLKFRALALRHSAETISNRRFYRVPSPDQLSVDNPAFHRTNRCSPPSSFSCSHNHAFPSWSGLREARVALGANQVLLRVLFCRSETGHALPPADQDHGQYLARRRTWFGVRKLFLDSRVTYGSVTSRWLGKVSLRQERRPDPIVRRKSSLEWGLPVYFGNARGLVWVSRPW